MELFEFCIEIIKREGERFNVGVNTSTASIITAATASEINYDNAHNRCSYLYRCGAINLCFAKDCFSKFLTEYKNLVNLLSEWINCPNMTLCSISKGPALDYIALLLAYQESGLFPSLFKNIKLISKYGAWRNTVNIMHEIISEGYVKSLPPSVPIGNIEVIQGDPFQDFTQKVKDPIANSDVVIMMKTLNLQTDGYDKEKILWSLQEFLGAMKPGAILLCIDTKPSILVITELLSVFPGKILFEPTFMNTSISLEYADLYKNLFGCYPVISARGSFFVWQKYAVSTTNLECLVDQVSDSIKSLLKENKVPVNDCCSKVAASGCSIELGTSPFANISKLPNITNSVQSKTHRLSVASVNTGVQNSERFSSCISLPSEFSTFNNVKKERKSIQSNSLQAAFNSLLVNECTQTEPVKKSKGTEQSRIIELSSKIANLTSELSEMLEKSGYSNDSHFKSFGDTYKHSILNDCKQAHCLPATSCVHKCQCSSLASCCMQSNHRMCHSSNNDISVCDNESIKCCSSFTSKSKTSTEDNSLVPQLVIPLNSLPANVMSQIIALLTQSDLNCKDEG